MIHRDSDRGFWEEKAVPFDASLLQQGKNTIQLTVPAGSVMNGVQYDYLRLEVDNAAAPPPPFVLSATPVRGPTPPPPAEE